MITRPMADDRIPFGEIEAKWQSRWREAGPEQVDARVNLGKTLYEMGRLKESADNLEQVLKRDPTNEKAQVLLKKMIE